MDYAKLLRFLNDSIDPSGKSGRHIVRFLQPSHYYEFIRQWFKYRHKYPALQSIRSSPLLQALFCPLRLQDGQMDSEPGLYVESDSTISVNSPASRTKERATEIPWGVKRIGAPEVWSVSTGHRIRIAVIDTGADYSHPDLRYSLARGIHLLNRASLPHDDNGHGTHIAGTIAAAGGAQGMIGVAPRSLIYPVKAFDHNGSAYVSDIILGIDWCIRNRMHIINMSFGMKSTSISLKNIVRKAHEAGVVIVASSGNDKKQRTADYPAKYAQTISVGATNRDGKVASFSNYGPYIDIYAPGEKITSSWLGGGHREMSGTSMATSHVSGAIALLLAARPNLTPDEIKQRLRRTARPLAGSLPRGRSRPGEVSAVRLLRGKTSRRRQG
ncbi:S8 family peptidase [Paenibacillus woosongensis]|uniref:S8 family peptidase n=1 Tax=Paenibacillus woosongensis TaxID=307580 RepID=A0AA95KTU7_9BACL|nr:S8 family peptidase [Paenibacillus woosongensis]WHX49238.1 S8 family peptidase [Paenibacillus woosongensis]